MSYIYACLDEYKNYEDDYNKSGTILYNRLFDKNDNLIKNYEDIFKEWINDILDTSEIPEGLFRDKYIEDIILNEMEQIIKKIIYYFRNEAKDERDKVLN